MSEFHVVVVEIGPIEKHPNADSLSVTQVMDGYPCIIRSGEFQPGDKAVYIPIDSLVPLKDPRFSFLSDSVDKPYKRIKAKKIRGIFSMGLLTKADPSWVVGQNVQENLGILKWEPEIDNASTGGLNVHCTSNIPVYDLEGLRKYRHLLAEGEEVLISEKLHGCFKDSTLILMADGTSKKIKDIEIGEQVMSYDETTSCFVSRSVLDKMIREPTKQLKWLRIDFENEKHLICTEDHLILTNKGWVVAAELTDEHEIKSFNH